MNTIKIDLGKGVVLEAPINLHMTAEEWTRMTRYINSLININKVKLTEVRK